MEQKEKKKKNLVETIFVRKQKRFIELVITFFSSTHARALLVLRLRIIFVPPKFCISAIIEIPVDRKRE